MRWRNEGAAVVRSGSEAGWRRDQPRLLSELRKVDSLAADMLSGEGGSLEGSACPCVVATWQPEL